MAAFSVHVLLPWHVKGVMHAPVIFAGKNVRIIA
jgi:hypothetical protein